MVMLRLNNPVLGIAAIQCPGRFDRGRLSQFQPETGTARPRNRPVSSGVEPDRQGVLP